MEGPLALIPKCGKSAKTGQLLLGLTLPLVLFSVYQLTDPYGREMSTQSYSIATLSSPQRTNLAMATRALDGQILRPGAAFSFNRLVGPRTEGRGYRMAPSYLEGESPKTMGGGICMVSSVLYQAALRSGMTITRRVPHLRTIRSIPSGLDATVWYGNADLEFVNPLRVPVKLRAQVDSQNLTISFFGNEPADIPPLRRVVKSLDPHRLLVEVFRTVEGQERLVSRDLYRLSP